MIIIIIQVREKMIEVGKASTGLKKAVGMWAKKTGLEHNRAKLSGRRSTKMSFKVVSLFPEEPHNILSR